MNPIAFSIARMAVDMCETGQMPQIRAVMSGASSKLLPFRKPSKKRGRLPDVKLEVRERLVGDLELDRAFALDARYVIEINLHSAPPLSGIPWYSNRTS